MPKYKRLGIIFLVAAGLLYSLFLSQAADSKQSEQRAKQVKTIPLTPTLTLAVTITPAKTPLPTIIITTVPTSAFGKTFFIDPTGSDDNNGLSPQAPFKTIQKAVDLLDPGDVINLAPGIYLQDIISKRDGTKSNPLTISGPKEAIIKGGGRNRVLEINHDYLVLKGFTIDGQHGEGGSTFDFRDKLIYVLGKESRAGVSGLKISGMTIKNAGGECIRLRYFAQDNEIANNTIQNCGVHDFRFNAGGKNGEGIYIGTAPEQLGDGKNPTRDPDQSNSNWIHNNIIDTQGNECVDIKEDSSGNIIENNRCSGQKDPNSGGMDSRGSGNTFRGNEITGSQGAGVRLGGDSGSDGINNHIYGNIIKGNISGGIKFQRTPQGKICGNTMSGNTNGNSVGTYGSQFNPIAACAN